ncbi:MAG: LpqB family beta-propeller domain-containing protein [Micrococcales bacterium]
MIALAASALALSGCAEIPHSSSVRQGPDIGSQLSSDYLYYQPSGPTPGETKADVLAGFLNASTGPQNDYEVAREYLAPSFKASWSPNDRVYIQSGGQTTTFRASTDATVRIGVSATVDALGTYSRAASNAKVSLDFKLVKVAGEWRISEAPNAVVMIRPVFDVIFHSYPVYFMDRAGSYLVPDLRWFPARASTATRLVSAILSGPTPWLAPAVQQPLPAGTKLAIQAVTIDKGTALVNLNAVALKAPKIQLRRFKSMIDATLKQLPDISSVQLQVNGTAQTIQDFTPASNLSGAFAPVVLRAGTLQQLIGPSGSALSAATPWVTGLKATDFAVSSSETKVALVASGGVFTADLRKPTVAPVLADTRKSLLSPRFDRRTQLWLIGADGAVHVVSPDGKGVWSQLSWVVGRSLTAFAVSPDGARIATSVRDKDGNVNVYLASVIRDASGRVTGFGQPIEIQGVFGNATSLQWAGQTNLMVLAQLTGNSFNLSVISIGGDPREVATLYNAVNIMASDDGANIYVMDQSGNVSQYRGYTWTVLATGVEASHMEN